MPRHSLSFPFQSILFCLIFILIGVGCSTTGSFDEGDGCDPEIESSPTQCPPIQQANGGNYAQFCQVFLGGFTGCTNVCEFATNQRPNNLPGDLGDFCVFDSDCGSGLTCDNDEVGAEMPCHCIPEEGAAPGVDCSNVTPGNGGFRAPCRTDADCDDGLPCCTNSEVSEACGVEVGFCECI